MVGIIRSIMLFFLLLGMLPMVVCAERHGGCDCAGAHCTADFSCDRAVLNRADTDSGSWHTHHHHPTPAERSTLDRLPSRLHAPSVNPTAAADEGDTPVLCRTVPLPQPGYRRYLESRIPPIPINLPLLI